MKQFIYTFALFSTLLLVSCTDAGKDQESSAGKKITLNGTSTKTDMGGKITQYNWTQVEQEGIPTLHLFDRNTATPSFIAPTVTKQTNIKFKLTTIESYNCKNEQDSSCRHHKNSSKVTVTILASDSNTTNTKDSNDGSYKVAISGSVKNTNANFLSTAIVSANNKEVTTRGDGRYSITNLQTSQRIVLNVTHPDYFTHSRIILANLSNAFEQNFTLYNAAQSRTFNPKDGVEISHNGATLIFPAGTKFVNTKKKKYTGNVTAKIRYITSDMNAFPGGYEGSNATENFPLHSHGFMYATIVDEEGNPISLASENQATLKLPVVNTLVNNVTVPMWSYDYNSGYWLEDATAISENGTFNANINHIGTYGLLTRAPGAIVTACVEDLDGLAISGANIVIRTANWQSNLAQTDNIGHITLDNILARESIQITSFKVPNDPASQIVTLNEGETRSLLDNCLVLSSAKQRADKANKDAKEKADEEKRDKADKDSKK